MALTGFCILVGLGVWQLERLAWKTALLGQIADRTTASPVPLPSQADWAGLVPDSYAYRHVVAQGRFDHADEARVFRPLTDPKGHYGGLGYLVLTPFRLDSGGIVIVNRGFVPENRLEPATRQAGQIAGDVTLTGLMREPESRNMFTPADDPDKHIWFTRDAQAITVAYRLGPVAPFTLDQDAGQAPGGLPQGGETVLSISNDHLSYALTWFGLALGLLVVTLFYARTAWASGRNSGRGA